MRKKKTKSRRKYKRLNIVGLGLTGSNLLYAVHKHVDADEIHLYDYGKVTKITIATHNLCNFAKPLYQSIHVGSNKSDVCSKYLAKLYGHSANPPRIVGHTLRILNDLPLNYSEGDYTIDCRDNSSNTITSDVKISYEGSSIVFDTAWTRGIIPTRPYHPNVQRSKHLFKFTKIVNKYFKYKYDKTRKCLTHFNLDLPDPLYLKGRKIFDTHDDISKIRTIRIFSYTEKITTFRSTTPFEKVVIRSNLVGVHNAVNKTWTDVCEMINDMCTKHNSISNPGLYSRFIVDVTMVDPVLDINIILYPNVA